MIDSIRELRTRNRTEEIVGKQSARRGEIPPSPAKKVKPNKRKMLFIGFFCMLILVSIGAGGWLLMHRNTSPVPKKIQSAVSFTVYYPDQKKLPAGYVLDMNSFSSGQGAVVYTVNYGGKKLFFSLQKKPTSLQIQGFYAKYLALHTSTQLAIGTATIGAINNGKQVRSLVSIPTSSNAWILITGPPDVNQDQLNRVLRAIKP